MSTDQPATAAMRSFDHDEMGRRQVEMAKATAADILSTVKALRGQVVPVKMEMSWPTLDAVKRAASADARPTYPWMPSIATGVPVIAADDVPDGKVRVTYSDESVEVIP